MTRPVSQIVGDLDKYPEGSDKHREVLRELDEYWKREIDEYQKTQQKGGRCG